MLHRLSHYSPHGAEGPVSMVKPHPHYVARCYPYDAAGLVDPLALVVAQCPDVWLPVLFGFWMGMKTFWIVSSILNREYTANRSGGGFHLAPGGVM